MNPDRRAGIAFHPLHFELAPKGQHQLPPPTLPTLDREKRLKYRVN
jgi:hypothetical protein